MDSHPGCGDDAPAVLQLHSWNNWPVPVTSYENASLSPSREILLLRSNQYGALLLPLGPPNPLQYLSCPSSPVRFPSTPDPKPPSTRSSFSTPSGAAVRTVSTPPLLSTQYATPSSSPHYSKFDPSPQIRRTLTFNSPSTPYFTPGFVPTTSSCSESPFDDTASNPATASLSPPFPFLSDVQCCSWACCGDGHGLQRTCGPFKELLFAGGDLGLVVHCFSPAYRIRLSRSDVLNQQSVEENLHQGSQTMKAKVSSLHNGKEGRWNNWAESKLDNEKDSGAQLDEINLERGQLKNGLISFVIDAELENSSEGLELKFKNHSWPSSAEVVSFHIFQDEICSSLNTGKNIHGALNSTSEVSRKGTAHSLMNKGQGEQPSETLLVNDALKEQSSAVMDIFSNPSCNLVGILLVHKSQGKSRLEACNEGGATGADYEKTLDKQEDLSVLLGMIFDWGLRWVSIIMPNKLLPQQIQEIPWSAFTLTNDRLLGLKDEGSLFVWAAVSGKLIGLIDIASHCGVRPARGLESVDNTNTEEEKDYHSITTKETVQDGEKVYLDQQTAAMPAVSNGDIVVPNVDSGKPGTTQTILKNPKHQIRHRFTRLSVTSTCLLIAVMDDQGLIYMVSTDDYFASYFDLCPELSHRNHISHDLRVLSDWTVAGSDIGRQQTSAVLPDRQWLISLNEEKAQADLIAKFHLKSRSSESPTNIMESRSLTAKSTPQSSPESFYGASGFTSRVSLHRHGAAGQISSLANKQPFRRVFIPSQLNEVPVAMSLSPYGITTMVCSVQGEAKFSLIQNGLCVSGGALDESRLDHSLRRKFGSCNQKRQSYLVDALPFSSGGFMYLVTATSLHVVLPPLAISSQAAKSSKSLHFISSDSTGNVSQQWRNEVLVRALICDGLEEAEQVCMENGWNLQLLRLKRLQLALDFVQVEEVEQSLEALVNVGAAEVGILHVLFAAMELMLNHFGSDNELGQASRFLALAALFTTKLIRQHGMKSWQGQHQDNNEYPIPCPKLEKYRIHIGLMELSCFLEVIRRLQDRLQAKRRGPNRGKADVGNEGSLSLSDKPLGRSTLEIIEEGSEDSSAYLLGATNADQKALSIGGQGFPLDQSSSALVPTSGMSLAGGVWELSSPGMEGGKSRKSSPLESPGEMFARWENENVDAAGIVRDALRASGRLALAVAQLHRLRLKAPRDGSQYQQSEADDVFKELIHIGRGIVYELLCKGKTAIALAALRRLGEDVEHALLELAVGSVRRSLRAQAKSELRRLAQIGSHDFQLLERVSLIERAYPSSSFWSTYGIRQQLLANGPTVDSLSGGKELKLVLLWDRKSLIECGELDGVVLGSWSAVDEPEGVEDFGGSFQESPAGAYWAAAAVWLQSWEQRTVDRVVLEQPRMVGQHVSWEARVEYNVAHHNWQEVSVLLDGIPAFILREGELHIRLDCEDSSFLDNDYSLPGVIRSLEQEWSEIDVEVVETIVPKIQILCLDLSHICSSWLWEMMEEKLIKQHIFLRTHWRGTAELVGLLGRAGLLFHRYKGSSSKGSSLHNTLLGPVKGSKVHKDAVRAIHELVVQHCVRNTFPHLLELYLDYHALGLDKVSASIMQALVGDCQWALWLLYSRLKGRESREYDASFANARTILAPSPNSGRNIEVSDLENFLPTIDDMAEAGGEVMALSTLMYAPVPLQKCLCAGSVSRHGGPSWQCTLENLQPGLQRFPTLWRMLVASCFEHDIWGLSSGHTLKAGIKDSLPQYLQWREGLFTSASGDTSLLQMLPRWLPQRVRRLLQLAIQGPVSGGQVVMQHRRDNTVKIAIAESQPGEPARVAEMEGLEAHAVSWEAAIQKSIEEELYAPSMEDAGLGVEHHLRRGRALAAFNCLLGSRVPEVTNQEFTGKTAQTPSHHPESQDLLSPLTAHEEKLLASVLPLAIMHYENTVVVAACALFFELCGFSANLIRTDVSTLRRISDYLRRHDQSEGGSTTKDATSWVKSYGPDVAGSLAQELADEYLEAGVGALSLKEAESSRRGLASRRPSKTVEAILQLLEKASLREEGTKRAEAGSPGVWLVSGLGDGSQLRNMQRSMSERWSLVTSYCRAHNLPLSTTYLATLAKDNDWVGFLAEAQQEGCSLDLLLNLVNKEFTDVRLQSHLVTVLKSLPTALPKRKVLPADAPSLPSTLDQGTVMSGELFSLLAECEHEKQPGKALLAKAKDLRWPLLAVIASCFMDVTSSLSCLTVWLEITAARETSAIRVTDAAAKISARVGAAVEATNAMSGSSQPSGFRYNRNSPKRRRRMLPEEETLPLPGPQSGSEDLVSEPHIESQSQSVQNPKKLFPTGQNGASSLEGMTGVIDGGGEQDLLAAMVAVLCEQQRFLPLLRAFELFTPASSFLPFVRFLQAFSQMRISEASAHLAAFSALLKEETHQQHNVQNRSGKSSTAWITAAAVAAADAMLAACKSAYERRCLLQLLAGSDFGDGGIAAMRFRQFYWKIQLAEPALRQGSELVADGTNMDDEALLATLEKSGQWEDARSWARQLDLNRGGSFLHHVTETQAEAMVAEWKELLWDIVEERVALWGHCQSLFSRYAFPALRAGMFFLKHADALEREVSASELHGILLLALQWLSGSMNNSSPVYPSHLLHELETRVWLLAVESDIEIQDGKDPYSSVIYSSTTGLSQGFSSAIEQTSNPVNRTASAISVIDSHLKRANVRQQEAEDARGLRQSLNSDMFSNSPKAETAKVKRRLKGHGQVKRMHLDTSEGNLSDSEESPRKGVKVKGDRKNRGHEIFQEEIIVKPDEALGGWEDRVGEQEVERAVLALLEVGQVAAARQLQQKLSPSHVPMELLLVDAAQKVAVLPNPMVNGSVTSSTLQPAVTEYLLSANLLEDVTSATPLQVLEVLTIACREGLGRGLCRRISAVAQAANFLGICFNDAFIKHPTQLLQLLALQGQDALAEAKILVATHSMIPASVARILAESFLKGLLAAYRGGYMESPQREEGPAPLLWRPSDFTRWAQVCPSEPELGHALMRLVISGHDIPHACEVELIILAHRYYESSACLDGVDVLVALAATRVEAYVSEGDFPSLARLVTGISNFQALRFILDLLIENGQLELLLQKRAAVDAAMESSASIRGFRMAVLSSLKLFNPHDLDAFAMVYSHFSMAHEMAALLESRGSRGVEHWAKIHDPDLSEETLEMMRFYVEASEVYAGIDAGNKTRWCCAQASLISLQLRMPELLWLNLTDTNARRLLVEQPRFQEALIVAEAYGLNQSAEWVPVIWNQMSVPGRIDQFLNDFVAALPITHSMLMELARFYRAEVSARGDHRDFSNWLSPGGVPLEPARHLGKSFRSLLRHIRDIKERLQLATLATGFPDVVDACMYTLDKVPDTAGPLILRKGHGGTYIPLM